MDANKHAGCKRQFRAESWYGSAGITPSRVDSITLGFYHPDGGTAGEFGIDWVRLGGEIALELHCFDDAWNALWQFRDVLECLADYDNKAPSPQDIATILLRCGVEDATARKQQEKQR